MSGECPKCHEHAMDCQCGPTPINDGCAHPPSYRLDYKCSICDDVDLLLCPADWTWHDDYWICPKCESIY